MAAVRISECDGKYVLIDEDGSRTKLISGAEVPEFDTRENANKWALDNGYTVDTADQSTSTGEPPRPNKKPSKKELAQQESEKDDKALATAHLNVLEKAHAERQAARIERALDKLSDEELEAEIARRRR